jgi:hypothetical protein
MAALPFPVPVGNGRGYCEGGRYCNGAADLDHHLGFGEAVEDLVVQQFVMHYT